ncbi:ceramidase [Gammaproteobacteria bacterium]|nr:ceramidase [Gammaproteobacteria bacterium]MDB4848333.1 ceramidase [Gammaproteobacteria bacterium]MDC0402075.1 ceramidase [Gammaproteobacteria bacterium]MDC0402354.1 ceramidase [Gammaproteobacteria bacterium]MDC1074400.1 ceramidase domain-containing protein [Gammaproteobacteria bacterium]
MISTNKFYVFYLALFVSVSFLLIFFLLSAFGLIQSTEAANLIGEASRWCERVSGGLFREPLNTLSNLGFMVAGLYMFWVICNDKQDSINPFIGITPISVLYASVVVYLGPGSMLMHGTNTEWGGWADNLSMIMFIILPWLYNIYSMSSWTSKQLLSIYISIVIIYSIWRWFTDWGLGINFNLFGVSIGLWAISETLYRFWSPSFRFFSGFVGFIVLLLFGTMPNEVFNNFSEYWWVILFWLPGLLASKKPVNRRTYKWYFLGMIAYFSAFAIWLTGVPDHELCEPDSIIQAHSIWHLLSALATYFFFLHFRDEKISS